MNYYVGVDLGGTNVRACKMDDDGNIIEIYDTKSYGVEGPKEKIRDAIFSVLDKISDIKSTEGIGIAVPGPVDTYKKVMTMSSNLVGFKDYPICELIEERYGLPVYIDNDANMAGLAEAIYGAGKGQPIVYYITHSTGIGGGLIVDGKLISGQKGYAGEIGNIIVKHDGEKLIPNLNAGSVESESSGRGIGTKAKKFLGEDASARSLFEAARNGDKKALEEVDIMADNMGKLLATISQIVDPHVFVFGGSVATHQNDIYWPKMKEAYRKYFNGVKLADLKLAELKEPGVIGAATLVKVNI